MAAGDRHVPDWRDAAAFEPLLGADRSLFAWEWLRRQETYRAAALGQLARAGEDEVLDEQPAAFKWGLHRFEDPRRSVPEARPVWRREHHALVLRASAEPSRPSPDAFDLRAFERIATLVRGHASERLLLSDGFRSVRLDIRGASLRDGPVRLRFELSGLAALNPSILLLRRLAALARTGRHSRLLHPPDRRARRHVLLLRAYDALREGSSQRTIAAELLDGEAMHARWRVNAQSLRSQVQRLVRGARAMASGGFRELLTAPPLFL